MLNNQNHEITGVKDKPVILAVDDQSQNLELLEAQLGPRGYEVVKANSGEEALRILAGNQIDLVLLDVMMPGMDGFEVTRRIRKDDNNRQLPIVLVTALRETEDRIKGIEAGCDDFLLKPVDKMELLARVQSLLRAKAYNDLTRNYRDQLESEVSARTAELKHTLKNLHQEITERKQAEEALRASVDQYYYLYEEAPNAYFSVNTDGLITMANHYAMELLGYPIDELIGKPVIELYADTPAGKTRANEIFQQFTGTRKTTVEELQMLTAEGRVLWITLSIKPILETNGRVFQSLSVVVDITERKQAEAKTRELIIFKEVDRLRSELLGNISHELRTPLASIKGFVTTLLRADAKWSDEEQQDFLQTIDQQTDRLTRLINDMMDISRIDAGALRLTKSKYTVSEILELIKNSLANITVNHKLKVIVPSGLPPVVVDKMRIAQVFTNLVQNAAKFSGAGSMITIEAQFSGTETIFSVRDTGDGIPPELVDKLFDRLYQTTSAATGKKSGPGLGLSICRSIVEAHGGRIWAESQVGKGSKFSFSLPAAPGE